MSPPTSKTFLYRDGTSQADRIQPALKPDYVSVDERTLADLLRFAREYSHHLRYFDLHNRDTGDWSGFLGPARGDGSIDPDQLASVAQALMEGRDPQGDAAVLGLITRPHVALYIAFAKLLGLAQNQLNELTRQHLEFYYETVLRMIRKPAEPDRVNVWFELAPHTNRTIRFERDTALIAKDHTGQPCTYRTTEPLFINRARIHDLRSFYVEKEFTTLQDASRLRYGDDPEPTQAALLKMLEIALGDPNPGDPLPAYPPSGETITFDFLASDLLDRVHAKETPLEQRAPWYMDLTDMRSLMNNRKEKRWSAVNKVLEAAGKRKNGADFVLDPPEADRAKFADNLWAALGDGDANSAKKIAFKKKLEEYYAEIQRIEGFFYMSAEDFAAMMLIAKRGSDSENDWRWISDILAESHKKCVSARRRDYLKGIREDYQDRRDQGFLPMVEAALGNEPANAKPAAEYPTDVLPTPLERLSDFIEPGDTVKGVTDPQRFLEDQYKEALKTDGSPAWDKVYHIVELAQRRREELPDLVPQQVKWRNLYSFGDARSVKSNLGLKDEDEMPRWKTFGCVPEDLSEDHPPTESLGWAISSPLLSLSEGARTIVLTLGFRPETFDKGYDLRLIPVDAIDNVAVKGRQLVIIALVNSHLHIRIFDTSGDKVVDKAENELVDGETLTALKQRLSPFPAESSLTRQDKQEIISKATSIAGHTLPKRGRRRLIDDDGKLVEDVANAFHVELSAGPDWISCDTLEDGAFGVEYSEIVREGSDPIPSIRYTLTLKPEVAAIAQPVSIGNGIAADWPVLRIMLRQHRQGSRYTTHYALLRDLILESAHLEVSVAGLNALQLQSDDKILDSTKPFEPFGSRPAVGSRFYIGHTELIVKELDEIRFDIDWMGLPGDGLKAHYATYGYKNQDNTDHPSPITDHTDFKINIALVENRVAHNLESAKELFTTDGDEDHQEAGSSLIKITKNLDGHARILVPPAGNQVLSWPRCLRWELSPQDFLHSAYPAIAARKAMGLAAAIANKVDEAKIDPNNYHVNPPYTPTIKSLQLGYVSSTKLQLDESELPVGDQLFHIHPFGYSPVQGEAKPWFLPRYDKQGELYIGIAEAGAGEIASILFQMAEGSANPDLEPEPIEWSYLDANCWHSLHHGKLRADETHGLINSGIIRIEIPKVRPSTRLPGDLIWLRAAIGQHPESVCDTVDLHTQAVAAEYVDVGGDPGHYSQPLAPESVAGLATPRAAIAAVHQPYTSSGGKPREHASIFYTRVAERLRHKQRALVGWDYERLILERFPEIHKAKCLPTNFERPPERGKPDPSTPGLIDIVVIPDIRNQCPFDPFAPKAPNDLLAEIERYLADKIPPYATVQVRNAHYVPVKMRFSVHFMPDFDKGYARAKLVQELNRFLSPWAYDDGAEITIGGRIYANSLVNFIDQRDYVDYVAALKLFKLEKHSSGFRIVFPSMDSSGYHVAPDYPDSVLVAARDHVIDVITDIDYEEESFIGINYMRVELDFIVAPNPEG